MVEVLQGFILWWMYLRGTHITFQSVQVLVAWRIDKHLSGCSRSTELLIIHNAQLELGEGCNGIMGSTLTNITFITSISSVDSNPSFFYLLPGQARVVTSADCHMMDYRVTCMLYYNYLPCSSHHISQSSPRQNLISLCQRLNEASSLAVII